MSIKKLAVAELGQAGAILTLGLQVSVNETHEMQIFQSSGDFRGVEAGIIFWDAFAWSCLQSAEEFTTTAVFHAQVQVIF